jgi:hypothetical protein
MRHRGRSSHEKRAGEYAVIGDEAKLFHGVKEIGEEERKPGRVCS